MNLRTSKHDNTGHKQSKFGTGAASKASMAQKQPQCMRKEATEPARTPFAPRTRLGAESTRRKPETSSVRVRAAGAPRLTACPTSFVRPYPSCAYDSTPLIITRRKPYRSKINPLLRKEPPRAAHRGRTQSSSPKRHCKPAQCCAPSSSRPSSERRHHCNARTADPSTQDDGGARTTS